MEKTKKITAAERKRKSRENLAKNMTEQEKLDFKKTERERVKKAMQQNRKKQKLNMTPEALIDHQKKEATRIRALRNKKKIITEQSTKEKAKAMLHIFSAKQKNPYKT